MKKKIVILGSTGSIGKSSLEVIKKFNKKFKIQLLTTNTNVKEIYKQAIKFRVKNIIVEDSKSFSKYKNKFINKNIKIYRGIHNLEKINIKNIDYTINGISGLDGLEPTLKIIKNTKNILIANKEAIICGWHLIKRKLKKHKTNFIPIDSEHFSINTLLNKNSNEKINKIYLTASGGPFVNRKFKELKNIKKHEALNHPNWNMGKKISIDSSTMINKIFELIEAKKIFNLNYSQISIIIHPSSYIHAIIFFNSDLIKFLAHNTSMSIPIANALGIKNLNKKSNFKVELLKLNNIVLKDPKVQNFPLLNLIKYLREKDTFFEIILVTLNDELVKMYLNGSISYISIHLNLLNLIKKPFLIKFFNRTPLNINQIKNMVLITKKYLDKNVKNY